MQKGQIGIEEKSNRAAIHNKQRLITATELPIRLRRGEETERAGGAGGSERACSAIWIHVAPGE